MNTRRLTDHEVRTQYFEVSLKLGWLLTSLGLGELVDYVVCCDQEARRTGGATRLYGWPDGTTVVLTSDQAAVPVNVDHLVTMYYEARDIADYQAGLHREQ